jgi:hypothetical protein
MKRARLAILATATAVFCLWPPPASAHLNSTGMGPVYDGLLHFLLSPEDIVPVVALAMFAGLPGRNMGGGRCFCFRQVGLWDAFSERCFNGPPRGQWPRFRFWFLAVWWLQMPNYRCAQ